MQILVFQYGDFGEAYRRFANGGNETYRDQRASVDFVASLAPANTVTTMAICDREHDETLSTNLRSIGIRQNSAFSKRGICPRLDELKPDLLICRTPNRIVLGWAARHTVPTLACFADIFYASSIKATFRNWQIGRILKAPCFPCVANHGLSSSQSLVACLGLSPSKIVPWEWQRLQPVGPAKKHPSGRHPFRLFYAGALCEEKGVFDCLAAVAQLQSEGFDARLSLAGSGEHKEVQNRLNHLNIQPYVDLLGLIPASDVIVQMREHSAVLVPSHHCYPEGLPNTIFEAFASGTPLIASDHPAFVNRLDSGNDSLVFRAGSSESLVACIKRLANDGELYESISKATANSLKKLYVGMDWIKLVHCFLDDPKNNGGWVEKVSVERILQSTANAPTGD